MLLRPVRQKDQRTGRFGWLGALLIALATMTGSDETCAAALDAATPTAGDTYVYRIVNQYNKEPRGEVRYRLEKVDESSLTYSVTPSSAELGAPRTQVHARDGNGLRLPLDSHGKPVEYVFATPYPAYVFPLEKNKSWTARAKATVADSRRARSVRVDGKMMGSQRVRVPAGEFDTVVIRRFIYAGDTDGDQMETRITEMEWYSPALGRAVRLERTSGWREPSKCGRGASCDVSGDWYLAELVEVSAANR